MKDANEQGEMTAVAQEESCGHKPPPEGEPTARPDKGELKRIEWLLAKSEKRQRHQPQPYGNLVRLNTARRITESVDEDVLTDIVDDYLDLLDTSAAIYEKNGDYALGIFSSGWCRLMDEASRNLCNTDDNAEALENENWHCHQSCWQTSRESIETGKPADIECKGGINIYAVPIVVNGEVIGSINFGYGDPPKDDEKIKQLSNRYRISVEELKKQSESYESRPHFIIELAKNRLLTSAKLLGSLIERNQAAESERVSARRYLTIFESVPVSIWEEDWSAIIEAIGRLRAQGVTDFAAYFAAHPEFVAEALGNVKVLDVNIETMAIFGAESKAEMLASLETVFATPDTLPGFVGELIALASGQSVYKSEMALRTVKGNLIQVLLTMIFPADGTGRVLVSLMDITERKQAEQLVQDLNASLERHVASRTAELEASNKELETANKEMQAFSYSISHDLRAPLRHINSFTELLVKREGERLEATSARYLQIISEAVGRMGRLIDELLAFSRTGKQELKLARVALNNLVLEAQRELVPDMKDRSINWSVGPLPEVEGDVMLLQSVITNLLSNAVKYTRPRADAHIQIGALNGDDGNATIFVKDNGVGFDMRYVGKLFGVFQRLHHEEEFEGIGIGLATVWRIITRHGGRVWAEGEVGRGATFYFTLKAAKED